MPGMAVQYNATLAKTPAWQMPVVLDFDHPDGVLVIESNQSI
jgi:hypothetical protein